MQRARTRIGNEGSETATNGEDTRDSGGTRSSTPRLRRTCARPRMRRSRFPLLGERIKVRAGVQPITISVSRCPVLTADGHGYRQFTMYDLRFGIADLEDRKGGTCNSDMRSERACNVQLRVYPRFEPLNPSDGCKFRVPASAGPVSPLGPSINYQLTSNQWPSTSPAWPFTHNNPPDFPGQAELCS
jgi:hypothetical protein